MGPIRRSVCSGRTGKAKAPVRQAPWRKHHQDKERQPVTKKRKAIMKETTIADAIKELKRELATRKRVYPNWVDSGKITGAIAEHRIACIEKAIAFIEENQPKPPGLFSQAPDASSGMLFLTKSGKKVRTYYVNGGPDKEGKVKCYVLNDQMELTGENLLCKLSTLQHIGFAD